MTLVVTYYDKESFYVENCNFEQIQRLYSISSQKNIILTEDFPDFTETDIDCLEYESTFFIIPVHF